MAAVRAPKVFPGADNSAQELLPTSSRFRCAKAIIEASLALLETPDGRASLVDVGTRLVRARNDTKNPDQKLHIYRRPLNEMPTFVNEFLLKIRNNFPNVCLIMCSSGEAATRKFDFGDSVTSFNPQRALQLCLHQVIIDNMLSALEKNNNIGRHAYMIFKFQMIISVAHEICHFFTHYLTGNQRVNTPPKLRVSGYSGPRTGESGRFWEKKFLGGCVEFYFDDKNPLGHKQAGIPYLMEAGDKKSVARQISLTYINNFVNGSFVVPISIARGVPPTTKGALGYNNEMSFKRPSTRQQPPATASRGNSPGTTRYREIPVETAPVKKSSRWAWLK